MGDDLAQQAWSDEQGTRAALELFQQHFDGRPGGVWAAPGRVNLIGDHVDYNDGTCLPMALPHRTFVAVARRSDTAVRLVTGLQTDAPWRGDLAEVRPGGVEGWVAYSAGPAWALREEGVATTGFDAAIVSCVPVGAGLSSSAAVECAMGLALGELNGAPMGGDDAGRARLAALCVESENRVAEAPTGGMDQAASLRSEAGTLLHLDCRDGSVEHVAFPMGEMGVDLVVVDTRASHELADGQYGQRRATCEAAARALGVASLREVADRNRPEDLEPLLAALPDEQMRSRARHAITEMWRVEDMVKALGACDAVGAGRLMSQSHASLRDDFEVSVAELDGAVEAAVEAGAFGARMTGGGFGGSIVALVPRGRASDVAHAVVERAQQEGFLIPEVHLVTPSAAAGRLA